MILITALISTDKETKQHYMFQKQAIISNNLKDKINNKRVSQPWLCHNNCSTFLSVLQRKLDC